MLIKNISNGLIGIVLLMAVAQVMISVASGCDFASTDFDRKDIIKILKSGDFGSVINQKVKFDKIGEIAILDKCYEIFTYEYSFKPTGGTAIHSVQRLFVISNNQYVGTYDIDDIPLKINGNVVEFSGTEDVGNKIVFDNDGPPKKVYLNGEVKYLYK